MLNFYSSFILSSYDKSFLLVDRIQLMYFDVPTSNNSEILPLNSSLDFTHYWLRDEHVFFFFISAAQPARKPGSYEETLKRLVPN